MRILTRSRAEILKIKPNLPLGLQLDPIILIGSDLTNQSALSAKWSENQLIDLDSQLSVHFENSKFTYDIISIVCSFDKSSQLYNTTDNSGDFIKRGRFNKIL